MKFLREKLRGNPALRELVQHLVEEHAPRVETQEPVTLPRATFDALVLAAMVGLEAVKEADEETC